MRDSPAAMAEFGSAIQSTATGLPAPNLSFNHVRLRDGTEVIPRSVLTTTESGQGAASVMEKALVDSTLSSARDATDGEYILYALLMQSNSFLNRYSLPRSCHQ